MNMKNSLQKRTPVQNLQMAVGTACAMGTAAMMSTVMAYADNVGNAIDKVFNVGNQVSNSIAKGLTNIVVPIGMELLQPLVWQAGNTLTANRELSFNKPASKLRKSAIYGIMQI